MPEVGGRLRLGGSEVVVRHHAMVARTGRGKGDRSTGVYAHALAKEMGGDAVEQLG